MDNFLHILLCTATIQLLFSHMQHNLQALLYNMNGYLQALLYNMNGYLQALLYNMNGYLQALLFWLLESTAQFLVFAKQNIFYRSIIFF